MKIAFFGTGLMGSGFVRRLRANGHEVNVWNRSAAKARKLEAVGARALDDPAAALAGAERLHLSLSDDATVDAVLEPLVAAASRRPWPRFRRVATRTKSMKTFTPQSCTRRSRVPGRRFKTW